MNKLFLIAALFLIIINVSALKRTKPSNKVSLTAPRPKGIDEGSFLETTSFELNNFYEFTLYVQAYELYNAYALNTGVPCVTKRQYWFNKKYDVVAANNFCKFIGSQINSSYLNTYLCGYILGLNNYFAACS